MKDDLKTGDEKRYKLIKRTCKDFVYYDHGFFKQ